MDSNGSRRGPIATLLLGVITGVLATLSGQMVLDRFRVEGRITRLEEQVSSMKISLDKIDSIKERVDFLYAYRQGQIKGEQELSNGKPTR